MSKLLWCQDSDSAMQNEDVRNLMSGDYDRIYTEKWALALGVFDRYEKGKA